VRGCLHIRIAGGIRKTQAAAASRTVYETCKSILDEVLEITEKKDIEKNQEK
jgi:hypothetical protein